MKNTEKLEQEKSILMRVRKIHRSKIKIEAAKLEISMVGFVGLLIDEYIEKIND